MFQWWMIGAYDTALFNANNKRKLPRYTKSSPTHLSFFASTSLVLYTWG